LTELVPDASVVLKWFAHPRERHAREARAIRARYRAGDLNVTVPWLLYFEMVTVAGRRWGWDENALASLAAALEDLGFDVAEPDLGAVAAWTSRGLTAYDAAYVAPGVAAALADSYANRASRPDARSTRSAFSVIISSSRPGPSRPLRCSTRARQAASGTPRSPATGS
jgi:predicted nucleic acid-binding protein